jgi:hypothetical protein
MTSKAINCIALGDVMRK